MTGPRRPYRRGSVLARALVLDAGLLGEAETARRALAHPSARVFRKGPLVLVELASPQRCSTEDASGTLLALEGAILSSAPLDDVERVRFEGPSALVMRHGTVERLPLDAAHRFDPAEWIDLRGLEITVVHSLGSPREAPADGTVKTLSDLRGAFGVGVAPPEAAHATAALRGAQVATAVGRALALLELPLTIAERWLDGLLGRRGTAPGSLGRPPSTTASTALVPREPSWLDRQLDRGSQWLRDLILRSQLGRIALRAQAEYLRRLLSMFDENDLEEALRHAIPLGGEGSSVPAIGTPSARTDLVIRPFSRGPGTSISAAPDLHELLRQRYRRAFELLVRRGEIDKAAFVLAELLHATHEAVGFLETHGRLKLAAELAEARKLPAGLVVRLWFLAGDRERAIDLARRESAFADAVLRLDRDHPEHAQALRALWADGLATSGAFAAAVEVAWPHRALRPLAEAWIERAIAIGGPTAARMRIRKLRLAPSAWSAEREPIEMLLESEGEDAELERDALLDALSQERSTAPITFVAQLAARAVMRRGRGGDRSLAVRLAEQSADTALLTELRALRAQPLPPGGDAAEVPTGVWSSAPRVFARSASDVGTLPIEDAVRLPDGRLLLALGELGVSLRTAEGREQVRFTQPATELVTSDGGDRIITVQRRGENCRLGRIDVASRRAEIWCDARVETFATSFDGLVWFVIGDGVAYAIDATELGWKHRWKLGQVTALERGAASLALEVSERRDERELWLYKTPKMTLAEKYPLATTAAASIQAFDARARSVRIERVGDRVVLSRPAANGPPEVVLPRGASRCWFHETVLGVAAVDVDGGWLGLYDPEALRPRAVFELGGARDLKLRVLGDRAVIHDDRGRLLVISLRTYQVLSELRL